MQKGQEKKQNQSGAETDQVEGQLQFKGVLPPAHKCSLCNSPDHRACGCEARAKTGRVENPNKPAEPHRELSESSMFRAALLDYVLSATKTLSAIAGSLADLVELEKTRRDLIKDISDGKQN